MTTAPADIPVNTGYVDTGSIDTGDRPAYPLLSAILGGHATLRPDRTAMIFGDRETTYAALHRHASRVACAHRGNGLQKGDRVAYLGKNSDLYFELLFGTVRAGGVLVAVNWRLALPEMTYILTDCGAATLFVERAFLDSARALRDAVPTLVRLIVMDDDDDDEGDAPGFIRWRDSAPDDGPDARPDARPDDGPAVTVGPRDPVIQMYTSGTTGNPKGVMMSNDGLCALRVTEGQDGPWAVWGPDEVNLVTMPFFHIGGTGWGIQGFYWGATNIIQPQPDPDAIVAAIARHRITKAFIVPAVLKMIVERPDIARFDLGSVKSLYYGASPIPDDVLARAITVFGCDFIQLYGMTETLGSITHLPPDQHKPGAAGRMTSCGKAIAGVTLAIVDPESGTRLGAGQVGEIVIRTPTLMLGYWGRPEATAEVVRDGWYHSGDAGYLDDGGYLYICDRIKDMIVSGAENIYPAEVENALHAHPEVADVAVIGVPDDKWGEAVKAVVVRVPGGTVTETALIAFARERIAGYKVPKSVDFVDALPRTASGKILKRELRKPYWDGRSRQVG